MTLPQPFRPLRTDFDRFLFARMDDEVEGVPLSVISALVRLGLDPWEEAGRLRSLGGREATEQLARLITDLPGHIGDLRRARDIACGLVLLLPHAGPDKPPPRLSRFFWLVAFMLRIWLPACVKRSQFWPVARSQIWIACLVIGGAALLSAVLHHGFPFGIGGL